MDELQAMVAGFAEAIRLATAAPRELAAATRQFTAAIQPAAAAVGNFTVALGSSQFRNAIALIENALGQMSVKVFEGIALLVPAFTKTATAIGNLSNALAPEFKLLASAAADVGRGLKTIATQLISDLGAVGNVVLAVLSPALKQTGIEFKALANATLFPVLRQVGIEFKGLVAIAPLLAKALLGAIPGVTTGSKIGGALGGAAGGATGAVFGVVARMVGGALGGISPKIGAALGSMGSKVGAALGGIGRKAGAGLGGVAGGLGAAGGKAAGMAAGALGGAAGMVAAAVGPILGKVATAFQQPLTTAAKGVSFALGKLTAPTAGAAQALGTFAKGLTSAIMGPFQGLAAAVAPFVQALNPGLMRLFNQAMRDLMATFGVAFAPIIEHVSAVFNELSATLAPAMHALAPIIDNLMSVLEGTFVPVIGMVADAFVALAPVIEFVTSLMASVAEAMRVVYTVLRSAIQVFYDVVKNMFGGIDLKGAAAGFQSVLHQLTKYFVQFAAYVAKSLGYLNPFAKALEKNLRDLQGKRPGVKAAPENVRVSGLEQISKDLALAAYAAKGAGGNRKKSEAEFLEEIVNFMKELRQNKNMQEILQKEVDRILRKIEMQELKLENWALEKATGWLGDIEKWLAAPVNAISEWGGKVADAIGKMAFWR